MALLLPWVLIVIGARLPIGDNSFLWHVTAGALQIEAGSVLTHDPFSFTFAGAPWRTQSWLADVGYALLDQAWGLAFVPWLVGAFGLATFALILAIAYRASRSVEAAVAVGVLSAWLGAGFFNPRPVLASYLALVLVVAAAKDPRMRWTLPLIIWMWAAVHGSFILGIGYVLLDGLRRRDRRAIPDAVAMVLVSSVTAHGLGVWQVLLEFAGSRGALNLITEWRVPNLTSIEFIPMFVGVVVLLVGAMRGKLTVHDLWVVVPFLAFGLAAARSVFPSWLALVPFIAVSLDGPAATRRDRGRPVALVVIAVLIVVGPFLVGVGQGDLSEKFPVEAAAALSEGRLFHDDVVGGYLIYRSGGARRVFVDDRAELYGEEHFRDTVETRNGTPDWRDVFDRWGITQALVRVDDGLARSLADDGWAEVYRDGRFVVFEPVDGASPTG